MSEDAASDGVGETGGEESNPLRRALDLLVFAPVGMALTVVEDLPSLILKGRERFETDVRNARVIGEFVVNRGQREVMARVTKLVYHDAVGPSAEAPGGEGSSAAPGATPPAAAIPKPAPDPADGAVVERALADYDTLSASQVVRRLESLGPDELRAIHRYESSHRNRRTILNRAQQLFDGDASTPAAPEPDRPVA